MFLLLVSFLVVLAGAESRCDISNGNQCPNDALHPALEARIDEVRNMTRSSYGLGFEPPEVGVEDQRYTGPRFAQRSADVVIGLVWGMEAETSRFVRSWLRWAPHVQLVLLVPSEHDLQRKAYLRAWGVHLKRVELSDSAFKGGELERFEIFAAMLEDLEGAEYVMVTDIRDVVVQGDPFAQVRQRWPGRVVFGLEDARLTVGSCPFNSHWVRYLFDDSTYEALRNAPVSCSGVTLGAVAPLRKYLDAMAVLVRDTVGQAGSFAAVRKGSDQGLHNCLVHGVCPASSSTAALNFDAEAALVPNERGAFVVTLAWVPSSELYFDAFGRLLDGDGAVPAVLHQFDRAPKVEAIVNAMYPARVGTDGAWASKT